jgi:hypothetical protein
VVFDGGVVAPGPAGYDQGVDVGVEPARALFGIDLKGDVHDDSSYTEATGLGFKPGRAGLE